MIRYCDNCGKDVEVQQKITFGQFQVLNRKVKASIKTLWCPYCHEEVYDEATEKQNELIVFSKYNAFCTSDDEKLHIGTDGRMIRKID